MTTLNDFKQLRASVSPDVQTELYSLFTSDPEASFQRKAGIAAEKGMTLTVDGRRRIERELGNPWRCAGSYGNGYRRNFSAI